MPQPVESLDVIIDGNHLPVFKRVWKLLAKNEDIHAGAKITPILVIG